ncbi:MAG: DNA polymerase III subunit epsilon [Chloroflexi bacterium]|nr:DNA polymerase III subunit epsilon [Chloroflexota bacterium]
MIEEQAGHAVAAATPSSPGLPASTAERVWVALSIVTLGPAAGHGDIAEIGAVKFDRSHSLESFHAKVKLQGSQRPAGETPSFGQVASKLAAFVGRHPIVGWGMASQAASLAAGGLRLTSPQCDLGELARVLLPTGPKTSIPVTGDALERAGAAQREFVELLKRAEGLDPGVLVQLGHISARSQWPLRHLLVGLEQEVAARSSSVGPLGVDLRQIGSRLERPRSLPPNQQRVPVPQERVEQLLARDGPVARCVPGYEPREGQLRMALAAVSALNNGHRLMVEGGTGIGKSLAYLLPAALFAVKNGARVVVSTNTINLQQQLVEKDLPAVRAALKEAGEVGGDDFRYALLKGKGNYLCLRRWEQIARGGTLSSEEAQLAARVLVWVQSTTTGDRAEIDVSPREAPVWDRVSATAFGECPGTRERACFYRAARERAAAAHILVVNHALLLADLALGGVLLPSYDHLVIDEAHHLEEEATHQFGMGVSQDALDRLVAQMAEALAGLRSALQAGAGLPGSRRDDMARLAEDIGAVLARCRDHWEQMWASLLAFLANHREETERGSSLRITSSARRQPGWSQVEVVWDNFDRALGDAARRAEDLQLALEAVGQEGGPYLEVGEKVAAWLQAQHQVREGLAELVAHPKDESVYWLEPGARASLHGAPLHVGALLQEGLFNRKECVVLTSATLTAGGSFAHFRERVGLEDAADLVVESPFDYKRAALLLVPTDTPEPGSAAYQDAVCRAVAGMARVAGGRTLSLFTSHSALGITRHWLAPELEPEGIAVLAQGVDGSPRDLLERFQEQPECVLLGTASFWEGVDVTGGAMKVLVVARLPFNVPTEPVFAARSELYENPFHQYALPQAVLRFRQGFGRLIRGRNDQGVVVVLDRRILSRSYGPAFLGSIPKCTVKRGPLSTLVAEARQWLAEGGAVRP